MSQATQQFYQDRFKNLYESFVDIDDEYCYIDQTNIDLYNLIVQSASKDRLHNFKGSQLCFFKTRRFNEEMMIILFCIPLKNKKDKKIGSKFISEKIMNLIKIMEYCFVDFQDLKIKNDNNGKFMYLIGRTKTI
jgi:hypothetical protein